MEFKLRDNQIISKSDDVTSKIIDKVSHIYLKYTVDKENYSSRKNLPISRICCTTDLDKELGEERVLIGELKGLIDTDYTVDAQFNLIEESDKYYKDNFKIFDYKVDKTKPLSKEKLAVIITSIFSASKNISERVYIISDETKNRYNQRSIDIVQQIYSNLPYYMRKSVGYNTYSNGLDESSRIKICITDQKNLDIDKFNNYIIDLSELDKSSNSKSDNLKNVIDDLLELNQEQKDRLFQEIHNIYSGKILNTDQFIEVFDYLRFYMDKEIDDSVIENYIVDFMYASKEDSSMDQKLYSRIIDDIKINLNNNNLNSYIQKNCIDNKSERTKLNKITLQCFEFIDLFRDEKKFTIHNNLLVDWIKYKQIPILKEKYQGKAYIEELQNIKEYIKTLMNRYECLKQIQGNQIMIKIIINQEIDNENNKILDLLKKEQIEIRDKFAKVNADFKDIMDLINNLGENINNNYKLLKVCSQDKIMECMNNYMDKKEIDDMNLEILSHQNYTNICYKIDLKYVEDIDILNQFESKEIIDKNLYKIVREYMRGAYTDYKTKLEKKFNEINKKYPKSLVFEEDTLKEIIHTIKSITMVDKKSPFKEYLLIIDDFDFRERVNMAKNQYANLFEDEIELIIFDNSEFRNAKRGFVLTDMNIYYKSDENTVGKIKIDEIDNIYRDKNLMYINEIAVNIDVISDYLKEDFKNIVLNIVNLLKNTKDKDLDINPIKNNSMDIKSTKDKDICMKPLNKDTINI